MREIVAEELLYKFDLTIQELEVFRAKDETNMNVLVKVSKNETTGVQPFEIVSINVNLTDENVSIGEVSSSPEQKKCC